MSDGLTARKKEMDNTLHPLPKRRAAFINFIVAITMSVLGNAVYSLLAHSSPYLPPLDVKLIGVITLASFLAVTCYVAFKNYRRLKEAGRGVALSPEDRKMRPSDIYLGAAP